VSAGTIPIFSRIKYLGLNLDPKLRWTDHIGFLRVRLLKYINILKWLVGRGWGLSPSQACKFANATIVAQLLLSIWFINAFNSNFKIIESIVISAYKIVLGVNRSVSNKTCWAISGQPTIKSKIINNNDKYIFRSVQLKKTNITNKIKNISSLCNRRDILNVNIPYLIRRWMD